AGDAARVVVAARAGPPHSKQEPVRRNRGEATHGDVCLPPGRGTLYGQQPVGSKRPRPVPAVDAVVDARGRRARPTTSSSTSAAVLVIDLDEPEPRRRCPSCRIRTKVEVPLAHATLAVVMPGSSRSRPRWTGRVPSSRSPGALPGRR